MSEMTRGTGMNITDERISLSEYLSQRIPNLVCILRIPDTQIGEFCVWGLRGTSRQETFLWWKWTVYDDKALFEIRNESSVWIPDSARDEIEPALLDAITEFEIKTGKSVPVHRIGDFTPTGGG